MKTIKAKVHMLPTDNGTNIYLYEGKLYLFPDVEFHQMTRTGQHLYITTDDEIKEGDWVTNGMDDVMGPILEGEEGDLSDFRKIIATTDPKLIVMDKISYGKEAGKEVETMLPEPPQSFIEEYCKAGGIDEVYVEYYEYLTLTDWLKPKEITILLPRLNPDNTIIIHPVEEKTYSVDVMTKVLIDFSNNFLKVRNQVTESEAKKWIEENL